MKKSIIARMLTTIAAVLIITDIGLLAMGYASVSATVHKTYVSYAMASATVAADLLDGVEMEKLQSDKEFAEYYKKVLENLCQKNDLAYLYVYIPDIKNNTITFVILAYGEEGSSEAAKERLPGTVVSYKLTESEICAWNGKETENVEETDNKYGHVMTAYSVVYDKNGEASALAGADVSMEEASRIFFNRYRMMIAAVAVSFLFVLGALAVLLKASVLKPAEIISRHMKSFTADRQSRFEKIEVKGSDEFAQMADTFNHMAEEIEQYINNIHELTEEKHRQEAEINIAGKIQMGLLPDKSFRGYGIKLKAVMLPAKYVGGDFYDYFCPTKDTVCTVIADVSGKGISAALFMASAITVIKQYAMLGYSPAEILFHANNTLSSSNPEQMFLTIFVGIYNRITHKFTYANGGHNTPYLISDSIRELDAVRGMAVSIFEEETYEEAEVALKEGDTIFLYTDGVNEAVSRENEFFGVNRLEKILEKKEKEQCIETVLREVKEFAKDALQSDDITMLSFCVLPDSYITVGAELENLDTVQKLIVENRQIPENLKKKLCLAAEEIFVNICSYAYDKEQGMVEISMEVSDKVVLQFCDNGKQFNPLENEADIEHYDLDTQIGGLGRWIAFDMADKVNYEYSNGKNILTLIKFLKEE